MDGHNAYFIEVADEPAGVVVRQGRGYKFFATTRRFHALDGQIFGTPSRAELAARRVAERYASRERNSA